MKARNRLTQPACKDEGRPRNGSGGEKTVWIGSISEKTQKKNHSRKKLGVIRNALDVYHEAHKFFAADDTLCYENAVWEQIHKMECDLAGIGIGTLELLEAEDQSVIDQSRKADAPCR